jgi:hypothetical protein
MIDYVNTQFSKDGEKFLGNLAQMTSGSQVASELVKESADLIVKHEAPTSDQEFKIRELNLSPEQIVFQILDDIFSLGLTSSEEKVDFEIPELKSFRKAVVSVVNSFMQLLLGAVQPWNVDPDKIIAENEFERSKELEGLEAMKENRRKFASRFDFNTDDEVKQLAKESYLVLRQREMIMAEMSRVNFAFNSVEEASPDSEPTEVADKTLNLFGKPALPF